MWAAGQRVGEYELVANLRSGGMATLFLAQRRGVEGFAKPVVIKLVHPELAKDEQFRHMFLDEARISSRIEHPNVVRVETLGEHEGLHYLVMEFVHGCSLAQLTRALMARGRRLAPAFAVRIAMHVADALHAAHQTRDENGRLLSVVHRDVSPENILLSYAGHVKLIDFGIAKAAYGRRHHTQEGLLKGKFRYMAPEQALGKSVDARTDIYQLGIVLWEMLTNRALFEGSDVQLLEQVRDPHVVPPSARVDRIPPALDAAVMGALAKNPARRHQDAQTFARALAKAVPSAHDVDSGALSALLLSTMQEHRQRERATYPPAVYDRLDQQVETLRMGSEQGDRRAIVQRSTVEHTAPYGSDPRASAAPPRSGGAAETAPGYGSPGQGASQRVRLAGGVLHERAARPRRLVRLASEIRTTITALEQGLREKRAQWLAIGAALGLSLLLAIVTVLVRKRPVRVPVSAPPQLPAWSEPPLASTQDAAQAMASADAATEETSQDAGALAHDAGKPESLPPARSSEERPQRRKLPPIVMVDGTPLIPEPDF